MSVVEHYAWPGNVRELANIVERLAIMHPGNEVTATDIRLLLQPAEDSSADAGLVAPATRSIEGASLNEILDDYERRLIERSLEDSGGNVAEAARRLRTDRPNLYRRMKRLGVEGPRDSARTPETTRPR